LHPPIADASCAMLRRCGRGPHGPADTCRGGQSADRCAHRGDQRLALLPGRLNTRSRPALGPKRQSSSHRPSAWKPKEAALARFLGFPCGSAAYVLFLGTFLFAIGFITGLPVPKTLDTGPVGPVAEALIVNLLLMSLFAVQHSVMARKGFKRWWTQFVPPAV